MNFYTFRRVIAVVALAGFALSAAAADQPDWLKGPLKKPLDQIRLGITVLYPESNSYQARYADTAAEYTKQLGVKATIMDPQGDPSKQFSQIQNLIAEHVDAMVVWPTSAVAVTPAIRRAHAAGIPVIISNSHIEKSARKYTVAFTGPDDCGQARKAAEMLVKALNDKGQIVLVLGTPGYATAMIRESCFLDVIKKHPEIKVLDKQPADWNRGKAQSVMEAYLTKYGKKIDGVYAEDDGMGLGVLNAIQGAGIKKGRIKLVTANMFRQGYTAIKNGWETGSVWQSPSDDAKLAIQTAIRVAEGKPVPKVQHIPTPKVDAETIKNFSQPTW
ncbi:MAG: sugar ABC transporter substrate-binding protein [Salinisphaera sp.]|jgi:ribose transport system substrate-binding protein|nr:sugar ABC transporter substrate-binding protein [Salinisphaera sp.]